MAINPKDPKFIRQRQLATFIPVLFVPLLSSIFWAFGGGAGVSTASAQPVNQGFNTDLPAAADATITENKLTAYDRRIDSVRNGGLITGQVDVTSSAGMAYGVGPNGEVGAMGAADQSMMEAQKQLIAAQQAQLNAANAPVAPPTSVSAVSAAEQASIDREERIRQLEDARTQRQINQLMAQADGNPAPAPAPRAVATKPKVAAKPQQATVVDDNAVVSQLGMTGASSNKKRQTAAFHGFDAGTESTEDANTLPAVIHESQEVVSGSLVKMRLTEPAIVNGHRLAANTFIYGVCSLSGERLSITIETLKSGNRVFPADLEVFDVDGLAGLHIPGAITRDAAKAAGAESLSAADALTMSGDPAMAAAGVAVTAVKGLGQRKIKLVKVRLKAGYNVMLKIDKQDN